MRILITILTEILNWIEYSVAHGNLFKPRAIRIHTANVPAGNRMRETVKRMYEE